MPISALNLFSDKGKRLFFENKIDFRAGFSGFSKSAKKTGEMTGKFNKKMAENTN
ncbi:MAG: hypothetical protein LBR34_09000 [Prevotella sp.]|jgi:hypothetical protein|nr:hypothetical protein [Prevotella sp.]